MPMDNATLQIRQVQSNVNPPKNYYSCADIKLVPAAADLAGVNNMPDLSIPAGADLSGFDDFDDLSVTSTDDAGVSMPADSPDMQKRPGADSAGVPGCSMGGNGTAGALGILLLALFALAAVPTLRSRRR
jgi:MYXO-CTERM domain-containing protein